MFLKDWEVQGPVEIIALSSQCAEIVLFYEADGDLYTWTSFVQSRKKPSCQKLQE